MLIRENFKKAPHAPGVYFFSAKGGKTLYIGKASNLRARLKYYLDVGQPSGKVEALLKEAKSLSWEVLDTEVEALIREAELIKKHRPKYNVLMRDDKQYFYVGFTRSTGSGQAEKFPKVFITHQPAISRKPYGVKRTAEFIGPFTEGGVLRSVLKTLRRAFPYCTCKKSHKNLCLNARIGRCLGYCCMVGESGSSQIYKKNILAIKSVLSGKNKSLVKTLKKEMRKFSDTKRYEEAGKIRDQIYALEKIFAHRGVIKQDISTEAQKALRSLESLLKINEIKRIEAYDIADIQGKFAYGSMAAFIEGRPQKDEYRLFKIKSTGSSNDPLMIKEIISRRFNHPEWPYPEVILVDGGKSQLGAALNAISHKPYAISNQRKAYSVKRMAVIALTKDKKHVGDHIFVSKSQSLIPLTRLSEPLKNLILRLDNEAHKFAINHYRRLHRKSLLTTKFTPH